MRFIGIVFSEKSIRQAGKIVKQSVTCCPLLFLGTSISPVAFPWNDPCFKETIGSWATTEIWVKEPKKPNVTDKNAVAAKRICRGAGYELANT